MESSGEISPSLSNNHSAFESLKLPTHPPGRLISQGAEARIYSAHLLSGLSKPCIVKERFVKSYRHPVLDLLLSLKRMRAEARQLFKCRQVGLPVPAVFHIDLSLRQLWLEDIGPNAISVGAWLFKILNDASIANNVKKDYLDTLALRLGKLLAKMHANNIIHGDLTTANILIQLPIDGDSYSDYRLFLIDFGLSSVINSLVPSVHDEEVAVDLYVLERALVSSLASRDESQLFTPQQFFSNLLSAYRDAYADEAVNRPLETEKRQSKIPKPDVAPITIQEGRKEAERVLKSLIDVEARGRKRIMIG